MPSEMSYLLTGMNLLSSIFFLLGFFYLRNVLRHAYTVSGQKSHYNWLYLFIILFFIRPMAELFLLLAFGTTLTGWPDIITRITSTASAAILAFITLEFRDLINLKLVNDDSVRPIYEFYAIVFLLVGFFFLPFVIFAKEFIYLILFSLFFFSAWVVASYAATFHSVFPLVRLLYGIAVLILFIPLMRLLVFFYSPLHTLLGVEFETVLTFLTMGLILAVSLLLIISMYLFRKTILDARMAQFALAHSDETEE